MVEKADLPPDQQLAAAREKADWSVERVAFALNLPVATIEALEAGQYPELHGEAYVVAYIRCYAELFSLDADALVARYREEREEYRQANPDTQLLAAASSKMQHKRYHTGYGIAAALTLLAALSLLSPSSEKSSSHAQTDKGLSVDTRVGTTRIQSLDQIPQDNPTLAMVPDMAVENISASRQPAEKAEQQHVPEAILSSRLQFRFSADCWVEVYDGDGERIFAALQKSDQMLQLSGKPPFRITLGYAPGVELSYNGEPVNIDTGNADIAKLILGNS